MPIIADFGSLGQAMAPSVELLQPLPYMVADTGIVAMDSCVCAGGNISVAGARDGTIILTVRLNDETSTYTAVLPGPVTAVW